MSESDKMKIEDLNMMHSSLEKHSGISNIYYCPSGDRDNCDCRKPRIGMLEKASIDLDFDLKNSLIVGDTWRDLEAGENAGIYTILLDTKYNKHLSPDLRIKSVLDLKKIL